MDPSIFHDIVMGIAAIAGAVAAAISGANNSRLDKMRTNQEALTVLVDTGVKQALETHILEDNQRNDVLLSRLGEQDKVLKSLDVGLNGSLGKATAAAKEIVAEAAIEAKKVIEESLAAQYVRLTVAEEIAKQVLEAAEVKAWRLRDAEKREATEPPPV